MGLRTVGLELAIDRSALNEVMRGFYEELIDRRSLDFQSRMARHENINGIAFIGSSGAGKSTLIETIKNMVSGCVFPKRYITRPSRVNETLDENIHVSSREFFQKVRSGEIGIHWVRNMENGRREYYGFEKTAPHEFPVYSSNNDFVRNLSAEVLRTILILGVYAPDDVRVRRLEERSPDMQVGERQYRFGDSASFVMQVSDVCIRNFGELEAQAKLDAVALTESALNHRVVWGEIRDLGRYTTLFSSRLFSIREHPVLFSNGIYKTFQFVERSPGVRALVTAGDMIFLNKEYRVESGGWDYRLPGGKVFDSREEYDRFRQENSEERNLSAKTFETVVKELREETELQFQPNSIKFVEKTNCGSVICWDLFFFHLKLDSVENQNLDRCQSIEGECTVPCWLSFDEVIALCISGKIQEDRSQAFLLRFILKSRKEA